jgi:hypothetical protein
VRKWGPIYRAAAGKGRPNPNVRMHPTNIGPLRDLSVHLCAELGPQVREPFEKTCAEMVTE